MEELYKGHGWTITLETATLPDGRTKTAARVRYADTAHILAFTDDGKLLLLHEYRPFYGDRVWMLPSGHIDKETDALAGAQRELREETGFRSDDLKPYCIGRSTEKFISRNHFFIARTLVRDPLEQDADEMIDVHELPLDEALDKMLSSGHVHMPSAYGLMRYMREHP